MLIYIYYIYYNKAGDILKPEIIKNIYKKPSIKSIRGDAASSMTHCADYICRAEI